MKKYFKVEIQLVLTVGVGRKHTNGKNNYLFKDELKFVNWFML